jgi:hypothetical protein
MYQLGSDHIYTMYQPGSDPIYTMNQPGSDPIYIMYQPGLGASLSTCTHTSTYLTHFNMILTHPRSICCLYTSSSVWLVCWPWTWPSPTQVQRTVQHDIKHRGLRAAPRVVSHLGGSRLVTLAGAGSGNPPEMCASGRTVVTNFIRSTQDGVRMNLQTLSR